MNNNVTNKNIAAPIIAVNEDRQTSSHLLFCLCNFRRGRKWLGSRGIFHRPIILRAFNLPGWTYPNTCRDRTNLRLDRSRHWWIGEKENKWREQMDRRRRLSFSLASLASIDLHERNHDCFHFTKVGQFVEMMNWHLLLWKKTIFMGEIIWWIY